MNDRLSELAGEIDRLRKRVEELEKRLGEPAPTPEATVPPAPPGPVFQFEPRCEPAAPPPPPAPSPAHEPTVARGAETGLEAEIGGNWLNKVGAVALVLGIAFFIKYAFDNRWVNETGRIVIGILVGVSFLFGGEYFQKRNMPKYAQGISGAGVSILYFTIYAAFAFYNLIPQTIAFAFMILVTITAIAVSVRHDAISIAVLGIIGGFLTPALIRGGPGGGEGGQAVRLFTYTAILDLGILGITYYKNWRALNVLSLAGTALIFAGWYGGYYTAGMLGVVVLFLTVFYVIFAAQAFVQNVVTRRTLNSADLLMLIAAPVLYFATSYWLLLERYHVYLGILAILMTVLYLLFARRVQVTGFEDKYLRLLYLSIGAGFLIIAVPIQLDARWVTIGWAAEAAVLAGIGFYMQSVRTRYVSLGLLALAAVHLLGTGTIAYEMPCTPFWNERFGTFLFVTAMTSVIASLYCRYRKKSEEETALAVALVLGANFLMIWALSVEVLGWVRTAYVAVGNYYYGSPASLSLSGVWAVYGILLLVAGVVWRYRAARIMAMVTFGVVILKSFLYDVWSLERVYRIVAFVGLGVLLLVASYVYQACRQRIHQFVGSDG